MSEPIEYGRHWSEVLKELNAENARLKAEVERLNTGIQPEGCNDAVGRAVNVLLEKEKENARLKAEVERLRKAGDGMQEVIWLTGCLSGMQIKERAVKAWNAAKEGKPSV
jgi:hypothetical protein